MSTAKTYVVSFCERNVYRITLTALSEIDALEKADDLYCDGGMSLFELDDSIDGTSNWQAEEVTP